MRRQAPGKPGIHPTTSLPAMAMPCSGLLRTAALAAIRLYQTHLSPHKGFCCAYRAHTGRASCSTLGYRAIRRHGVLGGLAILRARTALCGVAHRRHLSTRLRTLHPQRGVCDVGCDVPCDGGCDGSIGEVFSNACDAVSCCDCGSCDWPDRRHRKHRQKERYVYIPPRARPRQADPPGNSEPDTVPLWPPAHR